MVHTLLRASRRAGSTRAPPWPRARSSWRSSSSPWAWRRRSWPSEWWPPCAVGRQEPGRSSWKVDWKATWKVDLEGPRGKPTWKVGLESRLRRPISWPLSTLNMKFELLGVLNLKIPLDKKYHRNELQNSARILKHCFSEYDF